MYDVARKNSTAPGIVTSSRPGFRHIAIADINTKASGPCGPAVAIETIDRYLPGSFSRCKTIDSICSA